MPLSDAIVMTGQATRSNATLFWRVAAFIAAASPLVLMLILTPLYFDLSPKESPHWRPLISQGDEAANRGDLYGARRLYLQVNRVAYWEKDWEGLIAAACRLNKLDTGHGPYSQVSSILFRAWTTAERAQSRLGLVAVAKSFSRLGSDEAAAAVLAQIQPSWPAEPISFDHLTSLRGCF